MLEIPVHTSTADSNEQSVTQAEIQTQRPMPLEQPVMSTDRLPPSFAVMAYSPWTVTVNRRRNRE